VRKNRRWERRCHPAGRRTFGDYPYRQDFDELGRPTGCVRGEIGESSDDCWQIRQPLYRPAPRKAAAGSVAGGI